MNICKFAHISKCKEKRPLETKMNEKYIFISYAHRDSDTVVPIIKALSEKYNIWYDDGISVGSEWPEAIGRKIINCDTFFCIITKSIVESENCKNEISLAIKYKKPIVVVYLENVELDEELDLQLVRKHAIYYERFESFDFFIDKILGSEVIRDCLKYNSEAISDYNKINVQVEKLEGENFIYNDEAIEEDMIAEEDAELDEEDCEFQVPNDATKGLKFKSIGGGKCKVSGNYECGNVVVIPEYDPKGKMLVTEIASEGFYGKASIELVILPPSLEKIGKKAFCGTGIKEITFPSNLKKIGTSAFSFCEKLKKVIFQKESICNLTIGKSAFSYSGIEQIRIPFYVSKICKDAFCDCNLLKKVEFEENQGITLENGAFSGCGRLKDVSFGKCSVTKIKTMAFFNCSIKHLNIPSSVVSIGYGAFWDNRSLESLTFEKGSLTKIGVQAFANCGKLKKVLIPSGVKKLGGGVFPYSPFYNCNSLREIYIPRTVKKAPLPILKEKQTLHIFCEGYTKFTGEASNDNIKIVLNAEMPDEYEQ